MLLRGNNDPAAVSLGALARVRAVAAQTFQ
jgi:hypothetical protein